MQENMSQKPTPVPASSSASWRNLLLAAAVAAAVLLLLVLTGLIHNVWVQVVILGIVEGLTEFLPISSTAHLLIVADLLRFEYSLGGTFEIFIQLGAILAVVAFYARDLLAQARAIPTSQETRRFWLSIVIAFIPAAVIGLTLHDWIKTVIFESPVIIALALIVGGIIFIVIEQRPRREVSVTDVERTSWKQALAIGFAQVTALRPGVSRSGASIVGGMLSGLDRKSATAFSFYLAMPTLGGATVVDLLSNLEMLSPDDYGRLFVGTVVAGIVAWLSIGWLLRYVASNSFVPFGIYRIVIGLVILLLVALGTL
jgi:undecaprenyl-diphosphatase